MGDLEMNREKISKTLNEFLTRNKDYSIEIYLKSTNSESIIGRLLMPISRNYDHKYKENRFNMAWNGGDNLFNIPYEEVLVCYEEKDGYGSQTVNVIMKTGFTIELECSGTI